MVINLKPYVFGRNVFLLGFAVDRQRPIMTELSVAEKWAK